MRTRRDCGNSRDAAITKVGRDLAHGDRVCQTIQHVAEASPTPWHKKTAAGSTRPGWIGVAPVVSDAACVRSAARMVVR